MINFISKLFIEHPKQNNMTYLEHFLHSSNLSFKFFCASCKACIHSIFPFLYETSSTDYVKILNEILNKKI